MGRVITNWQCTPRVCGITAYLLSYTYDLAGDMTSASNGAGVTFGYSYNSALRLTGMTSSLVDAQHPATLLSNAHYGPFGVASDLLGNGINESVGYNARGTLQSYATTPSVYSFTLPGLAGNGTITAGNDSVNGNWTYGYDQFDRLLSSSKNSGAQAFTYDYDRYGNRWHQNVTQGSGPAPQYSMDSATNRISGSGITYDALGNVLTDGLGSTFTYDAENRLKTVVNSGGTYNYTYDAEGRRIKNASTEFVYDLAGRAISLFDATTGMWNYGEIYAGGRHVATYSNATTTFIHGDWLGTKRVVTNLAGTTSQTCTNLPFGDGASCTGAASTLYGFTDDLHDSESNLEHTWFRQLSTPQGRWMRPDPYLGSIDPSVPQTLNRYAYVANNPSNLMDPFGLVCSAPVGDGHDSVCNPANFGGGGGSGIFGRGDFSFTIWTQQPSGYVDGEYGEPGEWTYGYDITTYLVEGFVGGGGGGGGGGSGEHVLSKRRPGETFAQCFDRLQKETLGNTGQFLLNAVSGVSLFTAASTVQLGATQTISKPYIVAADRTLNVIKTVRPMSAAEIATGFAVGNRLLPAAAMNVVSKVAPIVSKASIWLTVGALAVEGGFALACN